MSLMQLFFFFSLLLVQFYYLNKLKAISEYVNNDKYIFIFQICFLFQPGWAGKMFKSNHLFNTGFTVFWNVDLIL